MTYAAPRFESKICPPDQLTARSAQLARPLVSTNGCFDILHRGHVTYLAQAAALGSTMIVALNTDASVKRLGKGDDRPVNALEDRLAVMASLACVTLVTWFDEETLQRILECRPDILVKGGDWPVEKIVGCTEVRGWGGSCSLHPVHPSEIDDRAAGKNQTAIKPGADLRPTRCVADHSKYDLCSQFDHTVAGDLEECRR